MPSRRETVNERETEQHQPGKQRPANEGEPFAPNIRDRQPIEHRGDHRDQEQANDPEDGDADRQRKGPNIKAEDAAVDAFCAPQKPNRAPATRRIWISSEPSVMR